MVQVSEQERAQVDALLECIAEAIATTDSVDARYANKTKLQKLLYLAIEEFDLPITYSWYLAGAVLPGDSAAKGNLESAFDRLAGPESPTASAPDKETDLQSVDNAMGSPSSEVDMGQSFEAPADSLTDSVASPGESTTEDTIDPVLFTDSDTEMDDEGDDPTDPTTIIDDRRRDIVEFYRSVLPEVWHQNTMRFLQNFYLEHAPSEYRELYVHSTHLRTRLADIKEAVQAHIDGEEPVKPINELVRSVGHDISDLHCTIRSIDTIAPTFHTFTAGTDIIEDGLMKLAQLDPDELTQTHLDAVEALDELFYYWAWRYPCLIISQETARGPSADALRKEREDQLNGFEDKLRSQIEQFDKELAAAGLQPHYSDYKAPDDEVEALINDLSDYYLKQ